MVALMDEDLKVVGETRGDQEDGSIPAKPISCHLIEVDLLGNVLWTWSYPTVDNELKHICLRKFNTMRRRSEKQQVFRYFRYQASWYYMFNSSSLESYEDRSGKLEKLDQVGVVVEAGDFNPERYQIINEVLFRTYLKQEDPTVVLQQFLSLIVSGTCQLPKKKLFISSDYDSNLAFTDFQIRAIISKFGLETILLVTAFVRKLRIVIYHHDIDTLVQYALSIPSFGLKINSVWDHVYPWVGYNDDEFAQFNNSKFHIIGCPNAGIENRGDLFDVFVNVPAGEINVATHAKDKMMMSKPHKEMALFLVQLAENDELNEVNMGNEIRAKIKELSIAEDHTFKTQPSNVQRV